MTMGRGENLQIVSFVLLCGGALFVLAGTIFSSFVLLCGGGIFVLAGTIFGFWGSRISGKGYWETVRNLTTNVEAARKRQEPAWTPFIRVDASTSIPPIALSARIQFRLWSDDITIPLMIRIASSQDGKFMKEVAGPSGVVEHRLITGEQTFYVSVSHPKIRYDVYVLGYELDI